MKRSRPEHSVTLRDLIANGRLTTPAKLVRDYLGQRFVATVQDDASVELKGARYKSLSDAASAAKLSHSDPSKRGHPRINGWEFWSVETREGIVPMHVLRKRAGG
jgi:hypothetical protein